MVSSFTCQNFGFRISEERRLAADKRGLRGSALRQYVIARGVFGFRISLHYIRVNPRKSAASSSDRREIRISKFAMELHAPGAGQAKVRLFPASRARRSCPRMPARQ